VLREVGGGIWRDFESCGRERRVNDKNGEEEREREIEIRVR
jgi:hypothetical protein